MVVNVFFGLAIVGMIVIFAWLMRLEVVYNARNIISTQFGERIQRMEENWNRSLDTMTSRLESLERYNVEAVAVVKGTNETLVVLKKGIELVADRQGLMLTRLGVVESEQVTQAAGIAQRETALSILEEAQMALRAEQDRQQSASDARDVRIGILETGARDQVSANIMSDKRLSDLEKSRQ